MPKVTRRNLDQHLSSYFHAEKKGSELIERLLEFAPGEEERAWIRIWTKEEAHHHRLWDSVAKRRGIRPAEMEHNVSRLFEITEGFVGSHNWAGSMVGAAVIEHLSNAAASYLYHDADDDMKRVFRKIVGDDLGHLDFDIHQIKKCLGTKDGKAAVVAAHKEFLKEIIEWPTRPNTSDVDMDILNDTYDLHRRAMARIGLDIPDIKFHRGHSFRMKRKILRMFV